MGKNRHSISDILFIFFVGAAGLSLLSCSSQGTGGTTTGNPFTDSSSSSLVAGAIGGAVSGAESNATLALRFTPKSFSQKLAAEFGLFRSALAGSACPSYRTSSVGPNPLCTASGSTLWLDDSNCSYGDPENVWNGVIALISPSVTANCGTYPTPTSGNSIYRQVTANVGASTPGAIEVRSGNFATFTIDDGTSQSANLGNFDGDTIAPLINGGYGTQATFNALGRIKELTIAHHITDINLINHSIYTAQPLQVTENPSAGTRALEGQVTIYSNGEKVIGQATVSTVHNDLCCYPISGQIQTTFSAGANVSPASDSAWLVGKTETLTITACGAGTLVTANGKTENVLFGRCF